MLQKRKTTAWMLLASLIVMSIFISCFATSATRTYAQPQQQLTDPSTPHFQIQVKVWRGTNSTVGCVVVWDYHDGHGQWNQYRLPVQNVFVDVGTYDSADTMTITNYPDAGCQTNTGKGPLFNDLVINLPHSCGDTCKDYETPDQA